MSSDQDSVQSEYSEQLDEFESQLRLTLDDNALQQDVLRGLRELLREHRESEADIRRILAERHEAGLIREETMHAVTAMLDRALTEQQATLETGAEEPDYAATDVIDPGVIEPAPAAEQVQPGSILRDRFLLQREVAGGSMGVVFKALDRRLAEVDGVAPWVAIKVLNPKLSRNADAMRAIQQEAAKGRCLSHPNIVRFLDFDREDDLYFLVMEWIEGRSLAELLDDPDSPDLDMPHILDLMEQLGSALEYAHRCGVVHADVKPGNVMLTEDGHAKLIDFGVARIRQRQVRDVDAFDPGVLGAATPAYSSMQVLTGEDPVPADDVFSLACLLYRLVAGYRVFGPRNAAEAAEEGMTPQRPQGLSDPQWRALKKALSISRVTRFSSPVEFVAAFTDPPELPEPAREPSPERVQGSNLWTDERRTSLPQLLGAALLLAVAAGAVALWQGWIEVPEEMAGLRDRLPAVFAEDEQGADPDSADPDGELPTVANEPAPASQETEPEIPDSDVTDASRPDPEPRTAPVTSPPAPTGAETAADNPVPEEAVSTDDTSTLEPLSRPAGTPAPADSGTTGTDSAPAAAVTASPPRSEAPTTATSVPVSSATHSLDLQMSGTPARLSAVLRENGPAVIVALRRPQTGAAAEALELIVEDTSAAGSRTDGRAGQYQLGNEGRVSFGPAESTAVLVIEAVGDSRREPDRTFELTIRDTHRGEALGIVDVLLEDDEQRAFEQELAPDTVGFAVSQVSVAENETAAQIDVFRYRASDQPLDVAYRVEDVTATESADYFAPASAMLRFPPGERSARIIVPLVQDSQVERDEAFFIELEGVDPGDTSSQDVYRRVAVMIRDDDS